MKKIIILIVIAAGSSYAQTSWKSLENTLTTDTLTKVGIGVGNPGVELDIYGNQKISKNLLIGQMLSFGTKLDNVAFLYTPAGIDFPAVFELKGPSKSVIRDPFSHNPESPDPQPNLDCLNGASVEMIAAFHDVISVSKNLPGSSTTGGNILVGHNGSNAFIETQGTGTGINNHPGDLFMNTKCNRNVFVFDGNGSNNNFANGTTKVMSVGGKLNVREYMQVGFGVATGFLETSTKLYVRADAGSQSNGIKIYHAAPGKNGIRLVEQNDNEKALAIFKTASSTSDGDERFTVAGNGQVVISTTNADALIVEDVSNSNHINFKVKKNGYVFAREINVLPANLNFPDYVFEKDYKLLSIHEFENYINTNKHLPNVPAAKEINAEGINLAEMQVKQMEKIEEAFLYIIQLKKENDELKARLEKLENKQY